MPDGVLRGDMLENGLLKINRGLSPMLFQQIGKRQRFLFANGTLSGRASQETVMENLSRLEDRQAKIS